MVMAGSVSPAAVHAALLEAAKAAEVQHEPAVWRVANDFQFTPSGEIYKTKVPKGKIITDPNYARMLMSKGAVLEPLP